jgi:hypothetical protein
MLESSKGGRSMAMHARLYDDLRQHAKPGDVFAFGGHSWLSVVCKMLQGSPVSHTGIILSAATGAADHPILIEATVDIGDREFTVKQSPLKEVIEEYDGHVWWLPLSPTVPFEESPFKTFLQSTIGTHFDYLGAGGVVLGELLDRLLGKEIEIVPEDLTAYFCSELVAQALEEAKTVPPVNASEVSPKDLCKWAIFSQDYCYVEPDQGVPEIPGYNTIDPSRQSQELEFPSYEAVESFQLGLRAQFLDTECIIPTWKREIEELRKGLVFATGHLRSAGLAREAIQLESLLEGHSLNGM